MTPNTYNILIVDDSAISRQLIKRTLQMAQLPIGTLYEAADGISALLLLTEHKVDLVLADLHMPKMSGIEMTRLIMTNPETKDIAVVVVSAEPNGDCLEDLKRRGVRACIRKPFTAEMIRDVVSDVLGVVAQ
jgi:two-component system, chemotaxis family, chemotaxis protein CheY